MPAEPGQAHVMLMNLPDRLRALPSFEPPAGGWQRLTARRQARRRGWLAAGSSLALAASVMLAVGLGALRPLTDASAPATAPRAATLAAAPAAASELGQLIYTSQALESRLRQARPQAAAWDSRRARQAEWLEQELARIDAGLAYARASGDDDTARQLWRARVQRLDALVALHQDEAPALKYASYHY